MAGFQSIICVMQILDDRDSQANLVAILLCTFNGQKYLAEQLDSIEKQVHRNWFVIASDDGSSDHTIQILQSYQRRWSEGRLIIRQGPKKGFCHNFLSLACDPSIVADYYALCDQDDVWLSTKLKVACDYLEKFSQANLAHLYCGRTHYVEDDLIVRDSSTLFRAQPSFRNALVQSIAGGNTMVFNHEAKCLIEQAGMQLVPSHDWWIYLLITGAGGVVYYDCHPHILYRQHDEALVGGNRGLLDGLSRFVRVLQGRFKVWNDQNIFALQNSRTLIKSQNQEILETVARLKNGTIWQRWLLIAKCSLYRQTFMGSLGLIIAIMLNRV